MKILITGASGFIGSRVVPRLLASGHELTLLCRPNNAPEANCEILPASLESWESVVAGRRFDTCLHLAWIATPGVYLHSSENDRLVTASLALADTLYAAGLKHFIGAGTCIEYAPNQHIPNSEITTPIQPIFPYAIAKDRVRKGIAEIAANHKADFTWARIFYPYGSGEHRSRTITSFLHTLRTQAPLNLKSPSSVKDFIHADDVALALIHFTQVGSPCGPINVGTGTGISIRDLALLIAKSIGADPGLILEGAEPFVDPYAFHVANIDRLNLTGWRPSIDLESGIANIATGKC